MNWITREHVKVDRVACPWLIKRFIDPEANFLFVPVDRIAETAKEEGATPFDAPGVELGHRDGKCSFEAILWKYGLKDPALQSLAGIVRGADIREEIDRTPESPGLKAIAEGFGKIGLKDDHEILAKEFPVYDALYAYCREKITEKRP